MALQRPQWQGHGGAMAGPWLVKSRYCWLKLVQYSELFLLTGVYSCNCDLVDYFSYPTFGNSCMTQLIIPWWASLATQSRSPSSASTPRLLANLTGVLGRIYEIWLTNWWPNLLIWIDLNHFVGSENNWDAEVVDHGTSDGIWWDCLWFVYCLSLFGENVALSRNTWGESNAWCSQLQGNLYSRNLARVYRFSEEKANLIFRVHFPMSFRLVDEDGFLAEFFVPLCQRRPKIQGPRRSDPTKWLLEVTVRVLGFLVVDIASTMLDKSAGDLSTFKSTQATWELLWGSWGIFNDHEHL